VGNFGNVVTDLWWITGCMGQ